MSELPMILKFPGFAIEIKKKRTTRYGYEKDLRAQIENLRTELHIVRHQMGIIFHLADMMLKDAKAQPFHTKNSLEVIRELTKDHNGPQFVSEKVG